MKKYLSILILSLLVSFLFSKQLYECSCDNYSYDYTHRFIVDESQRTLQWVLTSVQNKVTIRDYFFEDLMWTNFGIFFIIEDHNERELNKKFYDHIEYINFIHFNYSDNKLTSTQINKNNTKEYREYSCSKIYQKDPFKY